MAGFRCRSSPWPYFTYIVRLIERPPTDYGLSILKKGSAGVVAVTIFVVCEKRQGIRERHMNYSCPQNSLFNGRSRPATIILNIRFSSLLLVLKPIVSPSNEWLASLWVNRQREGRVSSSQPREYDRIIRTPRHADILQSLRMSNSDRMKKLPVAKKDPYLFQSAPPSLGIWSIVSLEMFMDFADCLSLSSFTVGLRLIEKLNEHTESKTRSHSDRKNSIRYILYGTSESFFLHTIC